MAKTFIILAPGFPANEADTTCIPFLQLFTKACKASYPELEIVVLSFQYPFISATYRWHNITVTSFNGRNKGKLHRLMTWRKVWKTLTRIKKENDVVGILSFWLGECALVGKRFAGQNQLPHFTWILGQDAKKNNRYKSLINPKSENLIALSDSIAKEYHSNYRMFPKHLVPVGIDTSLFSPRNTIRDIDVMGAGSLIPLKRYDLFIQVIKELVDYLPKLSALICGKGTEKMRLLTLVKAAGLENNIRIIDELPHKEVLKLMQRSKVFLHTSKYEGYAVVCAEAMYAGAHVVSFCQPMKALSKHEHIVETKEQAVRKTLEILQDKNRPDEQVLNYSIEEISKRMMDLFAL